jgi:hypothetical protein
MKFYGSGLIPKANAANFFPFKIDLTAPELLQNKYRDSDLVNGFNVAMNKLSYVSSAIADYYNKSKSQWTAETQKATLSAAIRTGGSKKNKGKNHKRNTRKVIKKGGDGEEQIVVDINKPINDIFSAEALKNNCTRALYDDVFHSRNRIFLVDNQLPTYEQPSYEQLKSNAEKLEAEKASLKAVAAALPPLPVETIQSVAAAAGGGKQKQKRNRNRKTQKNKPTSKNKKKNKSRRL